MREIKEQWFAQCSGITPLQEWIHCCDSSDLIKLLFLCSKGLPGHTFQYFVPKDPKTPSDGFSHHVRKKYFMENDSGNTNTNQ